MDRQEKFNRACERAFWILLGLMFLATLLLAFGKA
ncbi:MAG: hypothetical protein JMDDDDMK_00740 [Acidobacteria bacterium]|nr:hypothetical protein [Acidobacteriota bacterium]